MKAQEFYVELKKTLNKGYKLTKNTKNGNDVGIRLFKNHRTFCPITAVCHATTGRYFDPNYVMHANKYLRLHHDVVNNIVAAADDEGAPKVRKQLKATLGI